MSSIQVSSESAVNVERKRGRPRRAAAEVVAGDALIESLSSVVDGVSVEGVKVSVEDASECKLLDGLSERVERVEMEGSDVESRLLARRERDALKKREKADAKAAREEAKVSERAAKKCERERAKALEKEAAKAAREEAKAAKKAEKEAAKEAAKESLREKQYAKEAAKAEKAAEKAAAKDAAKAAKVAAKEAAKAAKAEEKKRVSDEKKAARAAKAEENKKNKKQRKRAVPAPVPELLDAVAAGVGDSEFHEDQELGPQAYVVESSADVEIKIEKIEKTEVEMKRQPSTGYEAPARSGDSFCDP